MKKIIFVVLLGSLIMQSCSVRVVERNRGNVVVVKKLPESIVWLSLKRNVTTHGVAITTEKLQEVLCW